MTSPRQTSAINQTVDRVRLVLSVMGATLAVLIGLGTWAALAAISGENLAPLETTVDAVAAESAAVTERFLDVAEASAGLVVRNLERSPEPDSALRTVLTDIAREQDVIDSVYTGYPTGDFLFVAKSAVEVEGGLRIRQITDADLETRAVRTIQLDASLEVVSEINNPADEFDPRARPWYQDSQRLGTGWTEPYQFASSGLPGITYYQPVGETGDLVVGVDMVLTDVTEFLTERQPGENGIAAMVSSTGVSISGSNEVSDTLIAEVARVAAQSDGSRAITILGDAPNQQVNAITPIGSDGSWWLLVTAQEADFASVFSAQADRIRIVLPLLAGLLAFAVLFMTTVARAGVRRIGRTATLDDESLLATRAEAHERLDVMAAGDEPMLVLSVSISDLDVTADPALRTSHLSSIAQILRRFALDDGVAGRSGTREFIVVRPLEASERAASLLKTLHQDLTNLAAPDPGPLRDQNPVRIGWCELGAVSYTHLTLPTICSV